MATLVNTVSFIFQDPSAVLPSLSKLKGLAKDDKTENAMLRSRIDEQSQLIMILKNRADEAVIRTQTLEKINSELIEFRENSTENLNHEIRKFNLLDKRFNDLAENHEELIKYKDEYKRVNVELRAENTRLRDENARLFSQAILEKDEMIQKLEEKFAASQNQISTLEAKLRYFLNWDFYLSNNYYHKNIWMPHTFREDNSCQTCFASLLKRGLFQKKKI